LRLISSFFLSTSKTDLLFPNYENDRSDKVGIILPCLAGYKQEINWFYYFKGAVLVER